MSAKPVEVPGTNAYCTTCLRTRRFFDRWIAMIATYGLVVVLFAAVFTFMLAIFANYMVAEQPLEYRFQKFIIIYVDGRCRPLKDGVPVIPGGDNCERGTFYTDAPLGGTARMEQNLLDLMEFIDQTYRTKSAATIDVVP